VWVGCRALGLTSKEIAAKLLDEENLWVNEGTMYGPAGEGFIRINIATQQENLVRALKRIRNLLGDTL